jgi:hypothetical protein
MAVVAENWELWGPLAERYREEHPRRILALDGGGIRGLITLGVLAEIESKLKVRLNRGDDFRLAEYFDLIGGTSTGAIIAAGLALGMSVKDITEFYLTFGTKAFDKRRIWERWQSLYGAGALSKLLQEKFGADVDLTPQHLHCLLTIVTRNATTDSTWPISSNPFAKYNDLGRTDCNLKIPLWRLVRASTAAPVFFPAEVIPWDPNDPSKAFAFVDGGTTGYNNPAFLLFRMATAPAYRLGWPVGERKLLVISVGTGSAPVLGSTAEDPSTNVVSAAMNTLSALMSQAAVDQDVNCRIVGRCTYGGIIDRELHNLIPTDPQEPDQLLNLDADTGKAFLYARYNAELTKEGLTELGLPHMVPEDVRKMDSVDHMHDLDAIGRAVGGRVDLAHFGSFVPS